MYNAKLKKTFCLISRGNLKMLIHMIFLTMKVWCNFTQDFYSEVKETAQ